MTTGAGGTYLFSGLPEGEYIVRVTPPAGYVSTVDTAVPADTADPDTNTDDNDNGAAHIHPGQVSGNLLTMQPARRWCKHRYNKPDRNDSTTRPWTSGSKWTARRPPNWTSRSATATPLVATTIDFTLTVTNNGGPEHGDRSSK
ncbi:MAG: hypothetical protein MZV64_24360 [Ignavibacteriales bacterium]|nr:hypothetical protein [Ignavibacteriales bacterium]